MTRKDAQRRAIERRVTRLEQRIAALQTLSNRYTWARLGIFTASAVGAIAVWLSWTIAAGAAFFVAGMVVFAVVASAHGRVKGSITRHTLWLAFQREHLARMALNWDGIPPAPTIAPEDILPIERDLDLVGERSLHRLLDTAVSREGSARLRDWLAAGVPEPGAVAARQAVVRELAGRRLLRDRLRLNAVIASGRPQARWSGARLVEWLALHTPTGSLSRVTWVLTGLAALNMTLFALAALDVLPPFWGLTFIVYAAIYLVYVQRLGDPFSLGLSLSDPLQDLRAVFETLERAPYAHSPALRELAAPFHAGDPRPSEALRRVTRVLAAASVRHNPLLWTIVSALAPWDLYVMQALNRQRTALAQVLPRWLDAWFEIEALASLGTFADLNPACAFPRFLPASDAPAAPIFSAQAIGHPLIPDAVRVGNDFTLSGLGDVALITGSNMSGKSTFLRTLGVNLCLAYAGGPVVAEAFETIPFRLFTCIRVTDSVTAGISYFYAEVKRLKALLDALQADHALPLFFLIDEIFQGTNNRERLIGSEGYLRALAGGRGAGVISTHDLELVTLAEELPQLKNYHFEETIRDGRMVFDYTLRAGPSPTTNALTIMRLEGLPVDAPGRL
ncbi:MAG: hypothetical protein GX613_06145 [Chloroflexi bacterium]|nr:hypothetical protein [Chloroflexota bacterium]